LSLSDILKANEKDLRYQCEMQTDLETNKGRSFDKLSVMHLVDPNLHLTWKEWDSPLENLEMNQV